MLVSVITICYNSESTIADTINSVLEQDYPHIEYIVIDGNSTDSTADIVRSYGEKITKFITEKDEGIYDAMNKGLKAATGNIIGFINSDDVLNSNDCISKIAGAFQSSDADVVYGDKLYVSPANPQRTVRFWKAGEFDRNNYKKGWMTPHLSTYIKKACYDKYGHFRTDFKIAADYELMLRIIYKHKAKAIYLPITIAKMRAGGVSNSSLKNVMISNYEVYKSWKVNGLKISPLIMLRKPIKKLSQLFKRK